MDRSEVMEYNPSARPCRGKISAVPIINQKFTEPKVYSHYSHDGGTQWWRGQLHGCSFNVKI